MSRRAVAPTLATLVALLACNQAVLAGSRVVVSLDALHRGASAATVGVLMATFGLVPMILALHAGPWVDRVGTLRPMGIGTAAVAAGVVLPFAWPGLPALFVAAPLMGFGFMLFQVAVQHATGDLGSPGDRASNFGTLALGASVASFAGPLIAGFAIDHAGHRAAFGLLALLPLVPVAVLTFARPALPRVRHAPPSGGARGRLDLVRHPVLRRIFVANAMVAFGWDVHTIFVPIYGTRIGLSGVEIGAILSTFAAATFVVRFAIGRIVRYASEARVLSVALITAGIVYAVLPLTDSVVWLAALSFVLGLGLGAGQPTVLSLLHAHAPPGRVGEAAGVRISMIQAMAVGVPLVFGVIGSSVGLAAVFWGAGACLGAGGLAVRRAPR